MSDANGRPIMTVAPTEVAPFLLGAVPVVVANQMPDVAPGATPVAYGNWKQAYTVVNRKAVTMTQDSARRPGPARNMRHAARVARVAAASDRGRYTRDRCSGNFSPGS